MAVRPRTREEKDAKNAAARVARKRGTPIENAAGCGICGAAWLFDTDGPFGLGVIRPRHPAGPCVARPAVPVMSQRVARCLRCKREFEKNANAQRFCSSRCREARRNYLREYYNQRTRERRRAA